MQAASLFAQPLQHLAPTIQHAEGLLDPATQRQGSAHVHRGVLQSSLKDVVAVPPGLLLADEELRVAAEDNRARRSTLDPNPNI